MRKEVRKEGTRGKEEEEKMQGEDDGREREQFKGSRRDCLGGGWSSEAEAGTLFVRWMF